jgi:hypothetical protein
MATRGSFQKRQKEAVRRDKRQQKIDRRQGRSPNVPGSASELSLIESDSPIEAEPTVQPAIEPAESN